MMRNDLRSRALRAAKLCRSLGLTQSQVAIAIGASQSQVSRIFKGQGLRASRVFEDLCIYAENMRKKSSIDAIISNRDLIDALADTWDGTNAHAKALAEVIRSLSLLTTPNAPARPFVKKVASQ